ncbi:alpha/beta-hydrolase, partial [Aureobasidium melanogenum]
MMRHSVTVPVIDLRAPVDGEDGYQGLNPREEILPRGWHHKDSTKALTEDILVQHDFGITVRDGCVLYADILRPAKETEKVPAIICWSPFGKKFNEITSLKVMTPWSLGIKDSELSGLEKFEAPDPADWVPRGYAIVNVDSRGSFDSEGTMAIMGSQEAEDGYDVIEEIAKQSWCNGNVGLAGNSHLAIVQWFIAALNPPSLKAIAPWEGCGDLYREQFARGGIYSGDLFDELIVRYLLRGRHGMESFKDMFKQHPLATKNPKDWWNDKRPDMKKIKVPTYITGTWTNTMHGMGAIRGWLDIPAEKKWLRWHPYQEWYDIWGCQQAKDEFLMFMDHYLKDIDNGWESTPKVRMAVLRFGENEPIANKVVEDFPIPKTEYRKLFFHSDGNMDTTRAENSSKATYDGKTGHLTFKHTFKEKSHVVGIPKVVVHVSCEEFDDMDIYICLRKLSVVGEAMLNLNIPWSSVPVSSIEEIPEDKRTEVLLYKGPVGILRASHRKIDASRSMHENWPFHPHEEEEKVSPGTVVRLEIGIWAMGVEYEAGESLMLEISGHHRGISNFGKPEHTKNEGRHVLHLGGDYDSHLIIPIVPLLSEESS